LASETRLLPVARVAVADPRFLALFSRAVSKIPPDTSPVRTLEAVAFEDAGEKEGLVGLTRWRHGDHATSARQTVTFYGDLFGKLSDDAAVAVIAHELAHAWLNEHVGPEESRGRERQADSLAREWGFGDELAQLGREAENIGGSAY
jgi:hypothetical protein